MGASEKGVGSMTPNFQGRTPTQQAANEEIAVLSFAGLIVTIAVGLIIYAGTLAGWW